MKVFKTLFALLWVLLELAQPVYAVPPSATPPGAPQSVLNTRARGFRGVNPAANSIAAMASPPTITVGANGAVSAITGAANGTMSIAGNDLTHVTFAGAPGSVASPATGYYDLQAANFNIRYQRVRFVDFGRRFEFRLRGPAFNRVGFAIRVDGQLVSNAWQGGINASGSGNQNVLVDFGANTETIGLLIPAVVSGGTGYAVDDVVTAAGGTGTAATVRVSAVTGGVVTALRAEYPGNYSVAPSATATQASTTGAGTGLTFSYVKTFYQTTIKARNIEIILPRDTWFGGLNIDTNDQVYPWPEPSGLPRRVWIGDSFGEALNADTIEGGYIPQSAKLLGDSIDWIHAYAGLGWFGGTPISSIQASVTAMVTGADRIVYGLGTNDLSAAAASITNAVMTRLNIDLAVAPNAIITVIAGFSGIGATETAAIQAGVAACSNPARVTFIDEHLLMNANVSVLKSSDNTHPAQNGHSYMARKVATDVGGSEAAMLGQ